VGRYLEEKNLSWSLDCGSPAAAFP
jgi:hypothetical protein